MPTAAHNNRWRFRRSRTCLLALIAFVSSTDAGIKSSANLIIIVNPAVKAQEVSFDDLRSVFLGTKTSLEDGSHLKPVLEKSGPAHAAFLKEYLGKTDSALQTYYRSLVFSGRGSFPVMLGSDAEVVAYVAKTRGAIGYVGASASAGTVKTLQVR